MTHSATTSEQLNKRWGLVILGLIVNLCLGTVYSWSIFREPLEQALGLTTAQSGLPYSVFLALFAFSMPVGGWLIGRIGARPTLIVGGLLVGLGWFSVGSASSITFLALAYGVVGGLGVGLAYGVPLAVVSSWFPGKRGLAMGITLTGFGLSPLITAPVAEAIVLSLDVAWAFRILGIAFFAIVAALSFWFVPAAEQSPQAAGRRPEAEDEPAGPATGGKTPGEMLRSPAFYGLWLCFAVGTLAGLTAIGMSAPFAREVVGVAPQAAALTVSAFGVFNGAGRPLFGAATDRLGPRATVLLSYLLIAVGAGFALLTPAVGLLAYLAGFAVLWMLLGGWLAIAPAATTKLFGPRHYAQNYGIMYTSYGVGALAGGAGSGVLYQAFGSFLPTFYLIIGACVLGAVVALVLLPTRSAAKA
jgi:OFA family oxalate/formate antiporter-like MFS transporter